MSPIEITLSLLLFATVMFVWERIPLALTAIIVCLALVLTGVLDAKSAFNGFINTNVILFVGMFIVGGALFETGMANRIGGLVTRFAKTERQLIVAIMVIVGLLSGVLSNTGTAAILIPVVIGIAAKSGFSRSRLLMPLVFAAAMGGQPLADRRTRKSDCTERLAECWSGVQLLRVRQDWFAALGWRHHLLRLLWPPPVAGWLIKSNCWRN